MRRVVGYLACLLLLNACAASFVEGGVYYSGETGLHNFDETGLAGSWALGLEFEDAWYLPSECGLYHRSMVTKQPELRVNDVGCKKRVRFGAKQ